MCGISGIVGGPPLSRAAAVQDMNAAIQHRGPDGEGIWSDKWCTLGHRRLSILDLSEAGRQPMSNEDGTVWLTFNGEIYNFPDLRRDLEARGHRFRSHTDSEAVIHGYEEWGAQVVQRLRGMFAFGIWDQREHRLLLARDRIGKKPLFYGHSNACLVFASELQAILSTDVAQRDVDLTAVDAYFSLGYIPAPHTIFAAVRKLPPACVLQFCPRDGTDPVVTRYWSLSHEPKLNLGESEAADAIRAKVTEAVRLRLASDVPLGAFLSGGVDSSVVVGLMAQLSPKPVKTFTIGFADQAYDERPLARLVAERYATDHTELEVEPDTATVLPALLEHVGEPFADSSAIPTYYVARLTRNAVTVALTGDGGDESFAGYDRYWAHAAASRIAHWPGLARATAVFSRLAPSHGEHRSRASRAARFFTGLGDDPAVRYARWIGASNGCLDWNARQTLYTPEFLGRLENTPAGSWLTAPFQAANALHPVDAAMSVDVATYLPGDLLVKTDITTMANGLEARSPFLDHEVMELAASLPVHLKLRGQTSKYLLRHAFADLVPERILSQPKRGFGVPVSAWCRTGLRPMIEDLLKPPASGLAQYLRHDGVVGLVDGHLAGREDHGRELWMLLAFELWHQTILAAAPRLHKG